MNPPETETKPRASGADLLSQAKAEIEEVQPSEAAAELDGGDVAMIDVREQHEFEERHIDGAIHVPRGYLETRIEQFVPDRSKRVILYCASGTRSAFAAKTLAEDLGYEDVASLAGGITLWRDRGLPVVTPGSLTQDQKERYSRHLLVPEIGLEGQLKLLDSKVLLLGAGGLGSPTGALPRGRRGRDDRPRRRRRRRCVQPAAPGDPQHRPDRDVEDGVRAARDRGPEPRRRGRSSTTAGSTPTT